MMRWLHIPVSNAKAYIPGTYLGLPGEDLQSYLNGFCYRFNRRGFGEGAFTCLAADIVGGGAAQAKG